MPSGYYNREKWKKPARSMSGLKGVLFCKNSPRHPWKAYIRQHGQFICIGYFESKLKASIEYNKMALKLYGPEAYFNPLRAE